MELIVVLVLGAAFSLFVGHLVERRAERRRQAADHGQRNTQG